MEEPGRAVQSIGSIKDIPPEWEVTCDSREDVSGKVFLCIRGRHHDGHEDAAGVLERGARLIIADHDLGLPNQLVAADTRETYALLCARHFGNPADSLLLVGITGTNGKTSTAHMLAHVLNEAGIPTGVVGTDGISFAGHTMPNAHTTPDPWLLHSAFAAMRMSGITAAVMEVSSQALDQQRTAGLTFEIGIFTNLSQDHLDYHRDMADYFASKRRLFLQSRMAVINIDDPYGRELFASLPIPAVPYRLPPECTFRMGECTTLWHGNKLRVPFTGAFFLSNALAAAAAAEELGVPRKQIRQALSHCPPVSGRAELLYHGHDRMILRDYAHTPDALEKILQALQNLRVGRIIVVFGCGGDRDAAKRPLMGKAAAQHADYIILTNDNPRSEDPVAILRQIAAGIPGGVPYIIIPDRRAAILRGIRKLRPGDLLLLAGKGHETTQTFQDRVIPFDEKEIVAKLMESENIPWKK